jgi:ribosomal protein L11 methyltransferase
LRVRPAASEAVADFLQAVTGAGVTIEPAITAFGPDEGYDLDLEAPLTLKAYAGGRLDGTARRRLRRALDRAGLSEGLVGRLRFRPVQEEDWSETWKEFYEIDRVGRVVIRPAWRPYAAAADEVVVSLDPGMAFGTGQHPTTRMCLDLLQRLSGPGDRVIDVGTGSGILAIAAIGLGARHCLAFDTEELAVKAAGDNLRLNGLSEQISLAHGSIEVAAAAPPFDLALANINAAAIVALAPALSRCLKPAGWLVASGIIAERLAECEAALTAAGFRVEQRRADGDWRALAARR